MSCKKKFCFLLYCVKIIKGYTNYNLKGLDRVKKRVNWLLFIVALFLLMSCSKNEVPSSKQTDTKDLEKTETKEEESKYTYPLTGLPTDKKPENRAVTVMVNNHPEGRPQSGLTKADLVFEILAEGGVTRFLAVFQSENPEVIGPVRSARPYYVEVAKGLDALYVHHGWSEKAQKMLESGYVDSLNGLFYDGTLFERSSKRKAPHNSYITYDHIEEGAEEENFSMVGAPEPYVFLKEDEEVGGTEQSSATISYSTKTFEVRYEYDPASSTYKRFSAGAQTVDNETGDPVLLNNIFIVETNHRTIDSYGLLDIDLTSGGRAFLLQKGKLQEIQWENQDGRIVPYLNGKEVPLVPGKTWINIVPDLDKMVQF